MLMRSLKLHTKITLVASVVTVLVLATLLWVVSVRVAALLRADQKSLAELRAANLAEQISISPEPPDADDLTRAAALVRGARPETIAVRVWRREGGVFRVEAEAPGSLPAAEIPDEARLALRGGDSSRTVNTRPADADDSIYRVFAPVVSGGRTSGAVEVVEQLEDAPRVAVQLERTALWLALAGVIAITLLTFLLFTRFVYRPLEAVLGAMRRAEQGDLTIVAAPPGADELGRLATGFNRMIGRLRQAADEQHAHQRLLEARVREATAALAVRNRELERANDELGRANQELWATTRRLTELERFAAAGQTAAQFAHEVGTPLNLISGHVQLLRTNLDADERARARLDTIGTQIERIAGIVRRMLDRTRPEAARLRPLDLGALLRNFADATAPLLHSRGVELRCEVAPGLPSIEGDADRLQQVFINLVNNALDACPAGGELRIAAEAKDGRVVVEVADTGTGMDDETRQRIFDPLFTTKRRGHGTGLGLVIVSEVVREHGGAITVESLLGRGTTIRLELPAASAPHDAEREPARASLTAGGESR